MPVLHTTLTNSDGRYALTSMPDIPMQPASAADTHTLVIDPRTTYQPLLGFGGTWTDTDVYNLLRMSPQVQEEVLTALLDPQKGAGWNFMRLPFGSTDWESTSDFYTYDDMPFGEKDWDLAHFSIQRDIDRGLFDLARRCLRINPDVVFLGSVWGVPGWMKENDSIMFGRFDPACTQVYARYLRMTIQAYAAEGIKLLAITPQNESLTSDDRATPACRFTWRLQKDVIIALRKELDEHGIDTQIWVYDHNFDMARQFVEPMLADPEARAALDAVAFHDYGGSPAEMGRLAQMYPEVPFYMTERHIGSVPEMDHLVQQLRNDARSYLQWTTMTDELNGPHQFLGKALPWRKEMGYAPDMGRKTFIFNLLDAPDRWFKSPSYYIYGQFTKYLHRGMVRVDSTAGDASWVTNAAFIDPTTGDIACVLVNQTASAQPLTLRIGSYEAPMTLPAMSVATCQTTVLQGDAFAVADAPVLSVTPTPAFDLEPQAITWEGTLAAGNELLLSCRVKNIGNLPTRKDATLMVQFSLDGDCNIARGTICAPSLAPGEDITVTANVPYGKKRTWTAEGGWHNIFAFVSIGNCFPEANLDNNRTGIEVWIP